VGTGNVSLAGSSLEYQGNTYISNGIVKLAANNELPNENNVPGSTGDLNLDGGIASAGVLDLSGFNLTLNALSGQANNVNGIITNSSTSTTTTNVLTLLQTLATTYNGQIMDHGATGAKTELFVTGPGSLMLNPTTNYLTGVQNSSAFSGGMIISNGYVVLGAPGGEAAVNMNVSELAPGTGPITLLGTNTSLAVAGSAGFSTSPTYEPLTNTLIVPAGQTASLYGPCRGDINSTLLGSGVLNLQTVYVRGAVVGNWTAFSGQIVLSATNGGNGNLGIGTNGFPEAMVIFTTNVDMYCGALSPYPYAGSAGGAICPIGALAGGNFTCQIESTSSGNGGGEPTTWEIGGLNLSTVYNGGIVDSNSLLKVGTGTLTLNSGGILGTNTITNPDTGLPELVINYSTNDIIYTGPTTVSNGVLALDAPVVLTNSSTVTLASTTAELDASEMGYVSNLNITLDNGATQEVVIDSTFEVVGGQTLAGVGTLNGFLQADPGSIFNVGLPTGIFNVTSNALLAGAITMNLDTTDAPVCSELAAPSFTINSATLVVTNSGPGLFNDVTFTLFNHPVTFAPGSVTLPATDPTGTTNYLWENNLAVNGSITLTNGGLVVGPASPPHITFSLSGSSLTLSWPPPYLGYTLQAQTNSVRVGLSNNWVNVTGSPSGTNITITINPANGTVFYRLVQ
jgi:hypothetical protein